MEVDLEVTMLKVITETRITNESRPEDKIKISIEQPRPKASVTKSS